MLLNRNEHKKHILIQETPLHMDFCIPSSHIHFQNTFLVLEETPIALCSALSPNLHCWLGSISWYPEMTIEQASLEQEVFCLEEVKPNELDGKVGSACRGRVEK
uniref:Uncharacterized protein n=1 Tax=Micrurus spixii TaxID=129469 RepID=A0A2D4MP25_9SAUR